MHKSKKVKKALSFLPPNDAPTSAKLKSKAFTPTLASTMALLLFTISQEHFIKLKHTHTQALKRGLALLGFHSLKMVAGMEAIMFLL